VPLALFDLDETLLNGDSDYLWGQYLVEQGVVDPSEYEQANQKFYEQYKQGCLDIDEFCRFAFQPLSQHPLETLKEWRTGFVQEKIKPIMLQKGKELLQYHRERGDTLVIITATNNFITQPIAELYQVDQLIATRPSMKDGVYTGGLDAACFAADKPIRLQEWLANTNLDLRGSYGYSDSCNDIPLLETVEFPHAVDPDDTIRAHAEQHTWPVLSLR
jgi:HAD superfamily hydrolase (TIGR01490 family)